MASMEATVGYVAVNFTIAHLRLEPLNASAGWGGSLAAEGAELEHQRLIEEQAYRDFSTTIQVLILLTSLLCKSKTPQCTTSVFFFLLLFAIIYNKHKLLSLPVLFTRKYIHKYVCQCARIFCPNQRNN